MEKVSYSQIVADLQAIIQREHYPRKAILHRGQTVCDHLFFIESGVVRTFYYRDGKDITAHIATDYGAITAIDSFIQRKRSRYTIEVLEDSQLIKIHYYDLYQLLEKNPALERTIRIFLEHVYIDLAERIEGLLFHTARERYEHLLAQNPAIIQRVDLKHIASYLGISQETLSRVRANQ
ncbi:Crp/Fnr family transcriptional regulator [Tunicatimonas pelagia]|uniref:Crp/Fnr family transcriptional regulator n=1 Tax=Tunicatimonas pelagia TaxID=931531 RepID=UPI002665902D|nr:Crp/Fnr family transcriptional regulator [Tunicatimonas pelagia]WKN41345.1 Crp/Fnr family transcriptional regulator [Tunicatimonas pelagia]